MSLQAIDSQIMIARAADYVNNTNAVNKRNEMSQEYMAVHAKAQEEKEQQSVTKTQETEEALIMLNDGGGNGAYAQARKKKKDKETESEESKDQNIELLKRLDLSGDHKIDITV